MQVIESTNVPDKQMVGTVGQKVISIPLCVYTTSLAPRNQEEADMRMTLHIAAAMKWGYLRILVRTVDTDVVVLAIWVAQELHEVVNEF